MNSPKTPEFGVSQYTTFPLSFEQDVELYSRLGVKWIEICEEKLSSDAGQRREQLAMVREAGLKPCSVQPTVLGLFRHRLSPPEEPEAPQDRMARFRQTIDWVSEAFPGELIPLVTGGGIAPNMDFRLAHRTARELYPPLADYAADRGVRLMFEPLSPVLMNAFTFTCTLDEAVQLVEAVDRPNFGLVLDVWHIWREPNIAQRVAALGNSVFGVHISDWPPEEPRGALDRVLPGKGVIDLPALLTAIQRSGYRGVYCLEVFSDQQYPDSLWNLDPAHVILEGRNGFLKAWRPIG